MTVTVIQIGLDPGVIDYSSPDFARFAGLRAAGYDVDNCLVDFGDEGVRKARKWLSAKRYDAVLIGAGVRLVANNTLLFEAIVNAAHTANPGCRFVFNRDAVDTPRDIQRWYPDPDDATPVQ
ncbi:hypothetical protein SAMN05421835_105305 [Amycolatopsis sacchari]|uniref:Uncharacterized protein n=1 Tax=Amycolatopsis sacchari TaxID=115433 RepID=A0A1I3RFC1_9PSEU|nr:hypothetical protein [Amycolatopsis sacchari]SFJ45334.1 hypothetical protein SAMN05421835_105305 [Amycolatopsis sacchari]